MEENGFPQKGQIAPSFKLPSLEHGEIGPEDLRGKKVVIAFYPKDNTSGWMKELTSFKEDYRRFQKMETEILAISADDLISHQSFSLRLGGIPFPMLSDEERKVIEMYGVAKEEGHKIRRSVFVLDRESKIVFVNRDFEANNFRHYEEIYEALEKS